MSEPKNLDVRMDQDSEKELQRLFDNVLAPNSSSRLVVPLRMRNLPNSFFEPPSTGTKSPSVSSISHSRENSGDSVFGTVTTTAAGLQINHSRAHSSPASLQQTYASAQQQHQHLKQRSYDTVDELGPLPPGWEQAMTSEGQVYFLNHINKTTTWDDPRKSLASGQQHRDSMDAAIKSACSVIDLHSLTLQGSGNKLVSSSSGSGAGSGTGSSGTLSPVGSESALGPLPEGWEQAKTAEGEIYYINHVARTTSWFDPRLPAQLQRAPSGVVPSHSVNNWIQPPSQSPLQITQLRLQKLKMEREQLKLRQQEIMRQQPEMLLHLRPDVTSGLDPFLPSAGALASAQIEHSRQESADSGLGMGNSYSLPQTPEDFLASIDDNMDVVSEGGPADMTGLDSQDVSIDDNLDSTEDLVPSLQLGVDFPNDILNDVQTLINTNRSDNVLTWL